MSIRAAGRLPRWYSFKVVTEELESMEHGEGENLFH